MKREGGQPSRAEWKRITSGKSAPVVRRILKQKRRPESDAEKLERIAKETLNAHLEDEDMCR